MKQKGAVVIYNNISKYKEWLYVNENELHIEYTDLQNDYHLHYDKQLDISFKDYCFDRFSNKNRKE